MIKKKYICEMCGRKVKMVHDHHIIPWNLSHDDSESNVIRLCPVCHVKADANFISLIMYGKIDVASDTHRRVTARYTKKYQRCKVLYRLHLLKYTFYEDRIRYNTKTGDVCITQHWRCTPYKYIDNSVKSRSQLNKAASAKGQVALSI